NPPVGFADAGGYVSIEAAHYTNAVAPAPFRWQVIPELGRTESAVTALPVTVESQTPGAGSPHLEYHMTLQQAGTVTVNAYLSPSFDFKGTDGLRYAVSFDDAEPVIVNMHGDGSLEPDRYSPAWMRMVADNAKQSSSTHQIAEPGEHVLKFWLVDPGVVLQKLVVDAGGLKESYLGPPESYFAPIAGSHAASGPTAAK
ncbi:MAG TPA: glycosyl hydrolase, partial [Rhodothermales bacterium]